MLNIGEIGKYVEDMLASVNMRGCAMVPFNLSLHLFLEDYFNCQGQFTCPSAVFHRGLTARGLAEGRCFALAASL